MELESPLHYLRALLVHRAHVTDSMVMTLPAGLWHARHTVPEAKLILLLKGSMRYTVGGITLRLVPGSVLYRPAATSADWMTGAESTCELTYVEYQVDRLYDTFRQPVWVTECDQELERASFARLRELQYKSDEASALESEGELKAVLARFFRRATVPESIVADHATHGDAGRRGARGNTSEAAVRAAQSWLNEHLDDPSVLSGLAERVGLSEDHFRIIFRRQTGVSARQYLTRVRMMAAKSYLERSSLSIKEVARRVGYRDALYFSRHYRKVFGAAPSVRRAPESR